MKKKYMKNSPGCFLLFFFIIGLSLAFSEGTSGSVSFSIQLREWFILEVTNSAETLKSEGTSGAALTSDLDLKGNAVQVRAFMSVAKNQAVQLRVQALGDLSNPLGETLAVSDIGWEALGEGFLSGVLSKNGSQIMAQWIGPGFRQGTVRYQYLKGQAPKADFSQKIVYSLAAV